MLGLAGVTDHSDVGHTHPSLVMPLRQIINKRTLGKSLTFQIVVPSYNLKLSDRMHAFTPQRERGRGVNVCV